MNIYQVFFTVLEMGLTASVVILAVFMARGLMFRLPKKYVYAMWLVVGIRLVCPVAVSSPLSVFNLLGAPVEINQIQRIVWERLENSMWQQDTEQKRETEQEQAAPEAASGDHDTDHTAAIQGDSVWSSGQKTQSDASDALQNQGDGRSKTTDQTYTAGGVQAGLQHEPSDTGFQEWLQQSSSREQVLQIAAMVWITGIAILLLWNIWLTLRMKKRLYKAVRYEENVYECDDIPSPFVLGLMRPRIYIPFRLGEQEREYILRHERYHIHRRDHVIKLIAVLLTTVYWFHPLVWLSYCCMIRDMEMSCDEYVLDSMEQDIRGNYSTLLLAFATNKRNMSLEFLAFGETGTRRRVRNIMRFQKQKKRIGFLAVALVLIVGVVCLTNRMDLTQEKGHDSKGKKSDSAISRTEDGRYRIGIASETIHGYTLQLVYLSDNPKPEADETGVWQGAFSLITTKEDVVCDEHTLQFQGVDTVAFPVEDMSLVVKDYDGDQDVDDFSLGQGQTMIPALGNWMQYQFFTVDEDGSIVQFSLMEFSLQEEEKDYIVTMPGDYSEDFTYEYGWVNYQGFTEEGVVSTLNTSLVRKMSVSDAVIAEMSPQKELWQSISKTMPKTVVQELQEKGVWKIRYAVDDQGAMETYYFIENAENASQFTLRLSFAYDADGKMVRYLCEDQGFLDTLTAQESGEGKQMNAVISFAKEFCGLELSKAKLTDRLQKKVGESMVERGTIEFVDGKSESGRIGVWKEKNSRWESITSEKLDENLFTLFTDSQSNWYTVSIEQNMVMCYESVSDQNSVEEANPESVTGE